MAAVSTAATAYAIGWEPQSGPQTALLACPVFEVFFGGRPRRRQDGRDARRMGLPCRSSRKERCRVDGPSRAGSAARDDRAKPANLCADRGEIQRSGQDVALAERSAT